MAGANTLIDLPESFVEHMQHILLPIQLTEFFESYNAPAMRGIRLNQLKPSNLYTGNQVVPWCKEGRIYSSDIRPAKNILFHAGLFYIQEPSAMCPVEVLAPKPGEYILDMCAAPGGKSVQIAGHLQGQGLLLANDASPSRSRALVKNLERMGVTNAVVTTETPKELAARFPSFFDKILVDAPCSGEGMFRRDAEAIKAYTANKPSACMSMQADILRFAAQMLKPGGQIVYSTCTFNTMENEGSIIEFLKANPNFESIAIDHQRLGISTGTNILPTAGRIFPHLAPGDGHFVALLQKQGSSPVQAQARQHQQAPKEFIEFCNMHLEAELPVGTFVQHGANLYSQPVLLDLRGIRVARSGWFLGEVTKGRFEPSQALAMGIPTAKFNVNLSEENATRYLKGESLAASESMQNLQGKPWVLMLYQGYPLGWAKLVQGRLKNNLPVGWVV